MRTDRAGQLSREVAAVATRATNLPDFVRRAGSVIGRAVRFDRSCWHSIDPATAMLTGAVKDHFEADARFARYEYAVPDVNTFAYLARRERPAGVLSAATGGLPTQSARYRDLLVPLGIEHELRAAFVLHGQCWGACALYRDPARPDFTETDAELLARLGPVLAEGVRRVLVLARPHPELVTHGPGIVILDEHDTVTSVSPTARRLAATMLDVGLGPADRLPAVVFAVAARVRAASESDLPMARAHVPTSDGQWLAVHGTRLDGEGEHRIAVIIDAARPADLAPVIASAYRLTERERDVAGLVLRGLLTRDIAARLHLSPHTVQDHLKAVFAKTGVHSRRELAARIFRDHYEPHLRAGHAPGPSGYFDS